MNKKTSLLRCFGGVLALWLAISGCGFLRNTATVGEEKNETQTVELDGAEVATVRIDMSAGELTVAGEGHSLMDAVFRYNIEDWRPKVSYRVTGNEGELVVEYPNSNLAIPVGRTVTNDWNLRFNNAVPIEMEVHTGAGDSELDLHALNLTGLRIEVSAGNSTVDLSGALDHDLNATITGGFGNLTVYLPGEMGVRVRADTDIGGLNDAGLTKDGDVYVNEVYGSAAHTLYLEISTGVGSINLLAP